MAGFYHDFFSSMLETGPKIAHIWQENAISGQKLALIPKFWQVIVVKCRVNYQLLASFCHFLARSCKFRAFHFPNKKNIYFTSHVITFFIYPRRYIYFLMINFWPFLARSGNYLASFKLKLGIELVM